MTINFGDGTTISTASVIQSSKVAQVKYANYRGAWIYRYYNGWIDVGFTLNITPEASNSKILVAFQVYCATRHGSDDNSNNTIEAQLRANGSNIYNGSQSDNTSTIIPSDPTNLNMMGSNTFNRVTGFKPGPSGGLGCISQSYLHSPNSTSQQQYKVRIRRPSGQGYQSWLFQGRMYNGGAQCPSSIWAMEIRA